MAYETIEVRPVTPVIGAEISGIDLSKPLGNQQFQEVHDALMEHQVLFFRDQKLTLDQHKAFGRLFGELAVHPNTKGPDGHPDILPVYADAHSKRIAGERWHSDVSCDPEPPLGSILYMHEPAENGGGDTMFANMCTAYEKLSDSMKSYLIGLTAVHDGEHVYRGRYGMTDTGKTYPRSEHPIVRTHPETGRQALFVNRGFTTHIPQLNRNESDALLEMLYDHAETPEFQCRFKWEKNSIAFWDNRAVMHHAMWDYFPLSRYAHRVTISGDKPFYRA